MYQAFYNLDRTPFENTPDPRFFYASEQHREALAAIEYTIRMRKGFVLITGNIGSGKTTISKAMCERCRDLATIVQVMHGHRSGHQLLKQIARSLGLPVDLDDEHATLLEQLRLTLIDQLQQNQPVVLCVDEAQTLSDEALEELRLLSNFDTTTNKLVQIILIGQPELRARIRTPQHSALRQRIVMAKQLRPMNLEETHGYIIHRLSAASADENRTDVQFTPGATREVFRVTGGIPRLINVTCDNCLLLGFVRQTKQITPQMVHRVVQDMVPNFDDNATVATTSEPDLSLAGSF